MGIGDNIHWLGHSGFRWEGSKTVYFDPYKIDGRAGTKAADIILVSHEHFDHCSVGDIAKIATPRTVIIASAEAGAAVRGGKLAYRELEILAPGGHAEYDGVHIRAVPSYNIDKAFHPKNSGKIGFVVTMDGVTVYHAGDTDRIPEMADIRCDIALLPVSGTYVMNAAEAIEAARAIKPKLAIPMHYGEVVGSADDATAFARGVGPGIEVKILPKER